MDLRCCYKPLWLLSFFTLNSTLSPNRIFSNVKNRRVCLDLRSGIFINLSYFQYFNDLIVPLAREFYRMLSESLNGTGSSASRCLTLYLRCTYNVKCVNDMMNDRQCSMLASAFYLAFCGHLSLIFQSYVRFLNSNRSHLR